MPASALEYNLEDNRLKGPVGRDVFDEKPDPAKRQEIERRLNFLYPYGEPANDKQKYSVSELNRHQDERTEVPLRKPVFLEEERGFTAAEKGLIYHAVMEYADFSRAEGEGMTYINEAVSEMVDKEIITEEEAGAVYLPNIAAFFRTDVGKRAAEAFRRGALEKEKPFVLKMKRNGEDVLVQGIIDCFFEEEDGFVLVDYKTNRIDRSRPEEEELGRLRNTYSEQLRIYREAIEKAKGRPVSAAYLYLANIGEVISM